MNAFEVSVNRRASVFSKTKNELVIPYSNKGKLWKDINHVALSHNKYESFSSPEIQDVIDFATAIFHLDKLCLRGEKENWIRKIHLKIDLRNPIRFREIEDDLKVALSILGGDNFSFTVSRLKQSGRTAQNFIRKTDKITDVVLFSGGQDSFIGAAKVLSIKSVSPLFVRINTHDKANPNELAKFLQKKFKSDVDVFSQRVSSISATESENIKETSQRLRSFYFLSLASVLAKGHDAKRVLINENGIMAIHLPLDLSKSSTFSTRTAYPPFLKLFELIINKWLGHKLTITNLYTFKTKSEILKESKKANLERALKLTISCAHSASIQRTVKNIKTKKSLMSKTANDLHCGYCFPCLLRRVSMWNAGLSKYDVKYAVDPFRALVDGTREKGKFVFEASSAVLGLIAISLQFLKHDKFSIIAVYPQIAECASVLGEEAYTQIFNLHKRFAKEIKTYIHENASYLNVFFNKSKSESIEKIIQSNNPISITDEILHQIEAKATDAFYRKVDSLFNDYRLNIQIALAEKTITENQIVDTYKKEIMEITSNKTKPIRLVQNDGQLLKTNIRKESSLPCPPFTKV